MGAWVRIFLDATSTWADRHASSGHCRSAHLVSFAPYTRDIFVDVPPDFVCLFQVLGEVGALPDVFSELEVNFFLLRRLLGVRSKEGEKQSKVRGWV